MIHLRSQVPERVGHIRRASAIQLALINPETTVIANSQVQHGKPVTPLRDRARPVGWAPGRQKPEITGLQLLPDFQGGAQMAIVHRVKSPPKNRDCRRAIAFHTAHSAHTR